MKFHAFTLSLTGLSFASTAVAVQMRGKTEMHAELLDEVRSSSGKRGRPNIVWILADDLNYEPGVFTSMPNLHKMRGESLEFRNHATNSPLCGPSRASLLVGRLPHNAGYKSNAALDSVEAFRKVQDRSVGKWLTDAGYYTAFLGKYVNAIMQHEENLPLGWRYFGGFTEVWDFYKKQQLGGAYTYYNTSQWDLYYDESGNRINKDNSDYPINIWTDVHQADFLATQTLEHAQEAVNMEKPFFIFANPTMVHHGYCHFPIPDGTQEFDDPWFEEFGEAQAAISPCVKREHTQDYLKTIAGDFLLHGRTSNWNKSAIGQMAAGGNCCDRPVDPPNQEARMEIGRRNRTASLADLDEMLGVVLRGLESMHVIDNTYVIFTSDNGFHLGNHGFWYGKELPYDHDVRVPMLVRTPWASSGVRNHPTTHVDITATIVELADAGSKVPWELDGKSFAPALGEDVPVKDWRQYSFAEMFEKNGKTWRNIRYIKHDESAGWSLNVWCSGDVEIFDLDADPDQLLNILDPSAGSESNSWGKNILDKFLPAINFLQSCDGQACNNAEDNPLSFDGRQLSELMECEENKRMMDVGGVGMFDGKDLQHEEGWD